MILGTTPRSGVASPWLTCSGIRTEWSRCSSANTNAKPRPKLTISPMTIDTSRLGLIGTVGSTTLSGARTGSFCDFARISNEAIARSASAIFARACWRSSISPRNF